MVKTRPLAWSTIVLLSHLNPGTILINTSRGPVFDEQAIKNGYKSGQISALILDVWNDEPAIDQELLEMASISTPHIAGYSTDGKARGTEMSVRALSAFLGLGMEEWSPSDLPLPENPKILLDCTDLDKQKILREIFLQSYDIRKDSNKLKASPRDFEFFRNDYPVRREAKAYSVQLINNPYPELVGILEDFEYAVIQDNCF